jgi:hypothetical protein
MLLAPPGDVRPDSPLLALSGDANLFRRTAPISSFFALLGGMGVLTFFQLVKIRGIAVTRQETIKPTAEFNKSLAGSSRCPIA